MSLLLHNPKECPPGYFRYVVPETGRRFPDPKLEPGRHYLSLQDLLLALTNHYQANGIQVPDNLSALVQDQLCRLIPPDRCFYETPDDKPVARHHLTFDQVIAGTKTLVAWQLEGRPKADMATINERAATCVRCPYNVSPAGCATCNSPLNTLVNSFVGPAKSAYDSALHACAICGCSLKALIQMPLDVVQKHLSQEQQEALPEYCWKKV